MLRRRLAGEDFLATCTRLRARFELDEDPGLGAGVPGSIPCALFGSHLREAPRLFDGNADDSAIGHMGHDRLIGDLDFADLGFSVDRSAQTRSPEFSLDGIRSDSVPDLIPSRRIRGLSIP